MITNREWIVNVHNGMNDFAQNEIKLGRDEYFVMGDNRNNSTDSRDPSVGNIHKKDILGRAWLRIWPLHKFELLTDN